MSVIDNIRRRLAGPEQRSSSMVDLNQLLQSFNFNGITYPLGLTQTLQGTREEIDGSFAGLVAQAYAGNGIVFACELARFMLFSEARFQFQALVKGRPGELFGNQSLDILESPWPGGVTGDLLTSALLDADLAGNAFIARTGNRTRLRRLRPDWLTIVMGSHEDPDVQAGDINADLLGYLYYPGGRYSGRDAVPLQPSEVAHFRPVPDPLASFRGMSWLTPVLREIAGDSAMTAHKNLFLAQGATPNMVVSLDKEIPPQTFLDFVKLFEKSEPSGGDAYKTMYLGGGADAKVVGSDLKQLDFKIVQGAGETRIAAAAGVPPVIAGFSEGLQAATYSNYSQARRRFVDGTIRPLWRNFAGSLQTIVPPPPASRLWIDDRDIAFLREDAKDRAEIQGVEARTIQVLWNSGYEPDSIVAAVLAEDWSRLSHTGLKPVQAQPDTTDPTPDPPTPTPPPQRDAVLMHLLESSERRALAAENRPAEPTVVNVHPADVNVTVPEQPVTVNIERGAVEVSSPITVEPTVVNVTTPEVRNEISVEPTPVEITVEPAPVEVRNDITVEPTPVEVHNEVSVEPTPVSITNEIPEQRAVRKTVVREDGLIVRIDEEPTDG